MGNPAMVRRKKTEKRRKKFEQRLGPGAYLPKEERAELQTELKKLAEAEAQAKEERRKAFEAEKAQKAKAAEPKA